MGFFDSLGNAGQRAKLNGEILLLDRELVARKKQFGVDMFDLIDTIEKNKKGAIFSTPELFKGHCETHIREPLETCRNEVRVWEGDLIGKKNELSSLEVKRERETKSNFGTWVSNSSSDAKLTVEITMLERQIKQRKEKFGIDVWDGMCEPTSIIGNVAAETKKKGGLGKVTGALGGITKGVAFGISAGLGKLSADERAVQECLATAKEDVSFVERSKNRKLDILQNVGKS
jgi:hypothetical protein